MPKVELTDRFCRTAKAVDGRQTDYFDTVVKGLSLLASSGGTKAFYLFYSKPDGRRARMKIGAYPDMTLGRARELARGARGEVGEGKDPIADKCAQAASSTVTDMVENYISRYASTKRSGDEIARRLRKNFSAVIGDIKLADLHRRDVTRAIDIIMDRGAATEANRTFEDIRAAVRWTYRRGDLDTNIVDGMEKPAKIAERDRVLSADEIRTMWRALDSADMWDGTKRILRLCLVTAQRVGEVAGMTVEELDLRSRSWIIPASRSKNDRAHDVPLSDLAIEIITEQIAANEALAVRKGRAVPPFIFPGPGSRAPVTAASIPKAVKRWHLDMPSWTPHDLRRSAATGMEEIGISPFVVAHTLNHVSATKASITSKVYARYDYAKEKREALELWADRLAGIVHGGADVVRLSQNA